MDIELVILLLGVILVAMKTVLETLYLLKYLRNRKSEKGNSNP
jgi:hypothetical protein